MDKILNEIEQDTDFQEIIKDIKNNLEVLKMKNYNQHFDVPCYDHCYMVSYYCYKLCKKHNLNYKDAAIAGFLHDMFLYDWREKSSWHRLHAFKHGRFAYLNAEKIIEVTDIEKDMIIKHMWPVTFFQFPKYKETWIIILVDKYCVMNETIKSIFKKRK